MKIKSLVKSLALTAGLAASFASHADFLDFSVDETPYGGEVVTADKLNGGYTEILTFDDAGNFTASAFASMNQLFGNDGTANGSQIGSLLGAQYNLYATFTATGTVMTPGVMGSNASLSADSGSFSLYLDQNRDTVATDVASLTLANTADDRMLGFSTSLAENVGLLYGFGGVFDFIFNDFTLTADGDTYFVSPTPFYMTVNIDGDFDTIPLAGQQQVTGDLSAVFVADVPEPSTIAVLALGLLGLGATSRRKA
ncbi:flocculation-associated PEP-CTERM protein PepA [Salinimonas marina]|uniref:Flocculation-associated PEP-CTERM protein PepA n=1 Tax=Salinimonas marina TaxID=2785918 RepID=A0A7S9DZV5_9ALTE|nr:flocculation-associated PEP-CTERM protein PepA [Salinimonas marina]QPG06430.1 flocculation-associated PEP-CTERM protein PepA [Salinimonas marina]